ncbi:MAG: restriction endonuclease subunit S [Clostridia bacterium]|nr:restriction endonuclease subunit S [Clostridia bacterium]
MSKVRLGDVAIEVRETSKDPTGLPVIGLEHLIPGEINLTHWSDASDNTFTKLFHKGQVLFGRRRAYLKKAAVAPFDGVCSGDITVIAAQKDKLLPTLLPFIISSDDFFDFAMEKSAGSLSPRAKWAQLAEYEFDLPGLAEQHKLATLLWSVERTRKAYQDLLIQTDELVKSQFVEMFGDPVNNTKGLPVHQLSDFISFLTSGSRGWAQYYSDEGKWFITIKNVKDCIISVDDVQCIKPPHNAEADRTRLKEGDLLISITADLGRTGVVTKEIAEHGAYINQHLTCIRLDRKVLDPIYVAFFMESEAGKKQFFEKNLSSVKAGLNFDSIRTLKLLVPPLEEQERFISYVKQTDKSKLAIRQALESLEKSRNAIMKGIFG